MQTAHWAHVRIDTVTSSIVHHYLVEHLEKVAGKGSELAIAFNAADRARLAGIWHDLGKYRAGFQHYIRQANGIDAHIENRIKDRDKTHSAAGALWAERYLTEKHGPAGQMMSRVLQYIIAGHHAGLDNWSSLSARLQGEDAASELGDAMDGAPPGSILQRDTSALSLKGIPLDGANNPGRFALWVRMLFSALVDADFLDTESFMDERLGQLRVGNIDLSTLKAALDRHLADFSAKVQSTPVNLWRTRILSQCRDKASRAPGVFTLTVPTGGGKTLSSLAFALDHAVKHGKARVIYAIPYTSIIEQTADIFRGIFDGLDPDAVIEHHSNAESTPEQETGRSRLACENWDAPLIVTTNVQLFESLFARRTSRCRKLHNIVNSVIVLDEAQLLPVEFLQPIVDVLRLLVDDFGVTLLLCTATQPVLSESSSADPKRGLRRGFESHRVTEVIDDVPALYAALKRVRVHIPDDLDLPTPWPDLADRLAEHSAVLSIVSRRADARTLFGLLRQREREGCWHLSALMCAQHRSDVIDAIKSALRQRREDMAANRPSLPVRVVSTQLVEAGVDLDFPAVYRALAGLDSIAQAAGRCNREGKLDGLGDVHVFIPPTAAPPGLLRQARETCKTLWHDHPADPFAAELFERYFRRLYHDAPLLDAKNVCAALRLDISQKDRTLDVRFRDASDAFRLIDDEDAATVLVRYRSPNAKDDINDLIRLFDREGPSRWLMRKLQRYGVTLYKYQLSALLKTGDIREIPICPGLYVQTEGCDAFYDPLFGVNADGAPGDPAAFVF